MTDPTVIGIMWNKNEGDILDETITKALPMVDHLLVSDDDSDDNSWDVIRDHKSELAFIDRYSEAPRDYPKILWQRQVLLDKAIELYGRDIWIQVIESDRLIIGTDIREQIDNRTHVTGISIWWIVLEAVRKQWTEEDDKFPNWEQPIEEVMPWCHVLEKAPYTWQPVPGIEFTPPWNPFPRHLDQYGCPGGHWRVRPRNQHDDSPLLGHYNVRGRTHFDLKYADRSYESQARSHRERMSFTIPEDNPAHLFPLTREGWIERINRPRPLKRKKG